MARYLAGIEGCVVYVNSENIMEELGQRRPA
jgi:hypothetical protein